MWKKNIECCNPILAKCENEIHTPKVGDLESFRPPKFLEFNSKVKNISHWGVLGVIGKVLKRRCPKWLCICHLDIFSPNYGQTKGQESNWRFDFRSLKVGNQLLSDIQFQSANGVGKLSRRAPTLIQTCCDRILQLRVMSSQSFGIPTGEFWDSNQNNFRTISGLQLESLEKKNHLDVASAENYRVYYMGEGGGFSQVQAVVSLVCQSARGLF